MRAVVSGDRPPFNETVHGWLAQRQASVALAASYEQLVEATRSDPSRLAVIWSDDGYKAVSAIRRLRDAAISNLIMVVMLPQSAGHLSSHHRAVALRAGADDAQTWPVPEEEFVERCRALIRRDRGVQDDGVIRFAGCEFRPDRRTVCSPIGSVSLTELEASFLVALTKQSERVITDQSIQIEVYSGTRDDISRSLIKVFVHRLRKHVAALTDGLDFLETVWGRGYRFVPTGFQPSFNKSGQRIAG